MQSAADELQLDYCGFGRKIAVGPAPAFGTAAAFGLVMMRNMMWAMIGAVVGVVLGHEFGLYLFSDPQAWIAAGIGASLGLIAYGGKNEASFVREQRQRLPELVRERRQGLPEVLSVG